MTSQPIHIQDGNTGTFIPIGLSLVDANSYAISTVAAQPIQSYDAFGRTRVASPTINFASNSGYGLEPLVFETRTDGVDNTAVWNANTRAVVLTLTNAGYVVRQSYAHIIYQPGRSQFLTLTGVIGSAVPGAIKRVGQFDAKNGLFFEQGATGIFSVVRRSSTSGSTVDVSIPQSEWNIDRLDGTGASGYTLDVSKDNIYIIDYGWLGTATVRYGLYIDGNIIYVHAMHHANILATSYMQTASLPFRYEISGTPASVATLQQICCASSSEGGYIETPAYKFSAVRELAAAVSTASEAAIIALRPKVTFEGIPNHIRIRIADKDVTAITNPVRWAIRYYPPGVADPVTGGSWVSANDQSGVEVNISGTAASIANSYALSQGFSITTGTGGNARGSERTDFFQTTILTLSACALADSPLTSNANGLPAHIVLTGLGASATAAAVLEWEEVR